MIIKNMTKGEFRKQVKNLLNSSKELFPQASEKICNQFLTSDLYKSSSTILSYMALDDEVNLSILMEQALKDGKKVYIPRIIPDSSQMDFYEKTSLSDVNIYGIQEPEKNAEKFEIRKYDDEILILTPGRAFSKNGGRLGRGKGYYDTYLARLKEKNAGNLKVIGIAFDLQVFNELPLEKHDEKMDYLVTEKGIIRCI